MSKHTALRSTRGQELTPHGADRRTQILRHAAALFGSEGFNATSISQITEAAGVAKGLFYFYFPSKQALLIELSDDLFEQQRRLIHIAQGDLTSALDRLYVGVLVTTMFYSDHYNLLSVVQRASRDTLINRERLTTSHTRRTAALIRQGQVSGEIRADEEPEHIALAVGSLVIELVHYRRREVFAGTALDAARLAARSSVYMVATSTAAADAAAARHADHVERANSARAIEADGSGSAG